MLPSLSRLPPDEKREINVQIMYGSASSHLYLCTTLGHLTNLCNMNSEESRTMLHLARSDFKLTTSDTKITGS